AFRAGVVILVLKVDLGIVEHRPAGLGHGLPAAECGQPPLGHPLGFLVLLADQPNDVLVKALGGVFHLDLGIPPVFVGTHARDGFDRLAVNAFADFDLGRVLNGHIYLPSLLCHLARAASHASAKRSKSSSVVVPPNETRNAQPASGPATPIARRTPLSRTLPEEQADPAETAKPARSICITCVSPFHPGVRMDSV